MAFADTESVAAFIALVARAAEPWQILYADNRLVSTTVLFAHLAALVASAGLAVTTDRAMLRFSGTDADERVRRLTDLSLSHRPVVAALLVSALSGILLLLADLEAFVGMLAFWVKMGLIILLIVNASLMLRQEQRLRIVASSHTDAGVTGPGDTDRLWARLRRHAWTSLTLWFGIVFAGTAMTTT